MISWRWLVFKFGYEVLACIAHIQVLGLVRPGTRSSFLYNQLQFTRQTLSHYSPFFTKSVQVGFVGVGRGLFFFLLDDIQKTPEFDQISTFPEGYWAIVILIESTFNLIGHRRRRNRFLSQICFAAIAKTTGPFTARGRQLIERMIDSGY